MHCRSAASFREAGRVSLFKRQSYAATGYAKKKIAKKSKRSRLIALLQDPAPHTPFSADRIRRRYAAISVRDARDERLIGRKSLKGFLSASCTRWFSPPYKGG